MRETLRRHVAAVNSLAEQGMYFFDYGNAFLLESLRAGADIAGKNGGEFRYPSYVEDIMGPLLLRPRLRSVPVGLHQRLIRRTWPPATASPVTCSRPC